MRRLAPLLLACAALLALPSGAAANAYSVISRELNANHLTIPVCRYSTRELEAALAEMPTYEQEYIATFADAVQMTIDAQANGACASGRALRTLASQVSLAPPSGRTPALPASITAAGRGSVPVPLIAILAIAGGALIVGAGLGGAYWFGYDPRRARRRVASQRRAPVSPPR